MQITNSTSIRGQGAVQTSKDSSSKTAAAMVSGGVLCRRHASNNIFFDATFVRASYDLEVAILQCATKQNLLISKTHVTRIHSCNSRIQGICHTHITPAPVPLVCKKLKIRKRKQTY
jgi:hypothetical protein